MPNVERVPYSPGLMNGSACDVPGNARTPPSVILLTYKLPSVKEVTLSGKEELSGSTMVDCAAIEGEAKTQDPKP